MRMGAGHMQAKFVDVPVEFLGFDFASQVNGAGWQALFVITSILIVALVSTLYGRV